MSEFVVYNTFTNENTMPVIVVSDFAQICRTCLSTKHIMPISVLKYNETPIVNFLDSCASIYVEENDGLPQNLCSVCLQEIIKIHLFQEKCKQNDSLLRVVLAEPEVIKHELDDETIQQDEELETETPKNYSDSNTDSNKIVEEKKESVHQKIKQENNNIFFCRYCSNEFASRDELKEHCKEVKHSKAWLHTKEKPFKCSVCSQSFTMNASLKRHMMRHSGEQPHLCNVCGKGFIQRTNLRRHLETHAACKRTARPKYCCSVCGRDFTRVHMFSIHLRTEHDMDELQEQEKELVVKDTREHICEICKKPYKTKRALKAHLSRDGEKKFLCSDCGKGFITRGELQSHLKVHSGETPYTCNVCKKSFSSVGSFRSHMLSHAGPGPFRCEICAKCFPRRSNLRDHLQVHRGEKPYSCTHCGKGFTLKGNLKFHARRHTPFICPVCAKGFYQLRMLKTHQIRYHSGEVTVQQCKKTDVVEVHQ